MRSYRVTTPTGYSRVTDLNPAAAARYNAMPGWSAVDAGPSRFVVVDEPTD